jgi:hypothetical protein
VPSKQDQNRLPVVSLSRRPDQGRGTQVLAYGVAIQLKA